MSYDDLPGLFSTVASPIEPSSDGSAHAWTFTPVGARTWRVNALHIIEFSVTMNDGTTIHGEGPSRDAIRAALVQLIDEIDRTGGSK